MIHYKRLFLAVDYTPDEEILTVYNTLKHQLRFDQIYWIEPQLMHITVRFFGSTDVTQIPSIVSALREVALRYKAFEIQTHQLGVFGSRYQPRVLWMGFDGVEPLIKIRQDLDEVLTQIPKSPHEGRFVPHTTLARIQKIEDKPRFRRIMETIQSGFPLQKIRIEQLILYQSILTQEGPIYKPVDVIAIK